ncbi:huntingtin-interacting protein 1 [Halyomorpha halys]|uniref:huntingtin-interacting protein 1 n=1 Tax=Halyomorpha halys TaxID=286706 RepID=UPI0034D33B84
MSSLSLPRVLHQRKTSLELERENFEKFQGVSISKAINQTETPVKEKHVRSAILGTFHEKCAETFWAVVHRLPLMDNRISAWKFCHVLHKVLREGHPQCIADSYRHISTIEDLGKLWGHLRDPYGKLIQIYSRLLITKIQFHKRNPRIPGNLTLTADELDAIGENDVNNYFQLSVEMFDYMDEILTLQSAIFGSLDMSRSNSMTSCGQCRLAPLIPLIQDSSQLYDICVKFLFKLHASLSIDILSGKYGLSYNPPNFLIQAELGSYVTPVVILPPEEDTISEASDLVDLAAPNGNHSPIGVIAERDSLIEHLQSELKRSRSEIARMASEHELIVLKLNDKISKLEIQLVSKETELENERKASFDLQHSELLKMQEAEKRARLMEDKFLKLKEIYTKLRDEHIQLIRQKADVDKQLSTIQCQQSDLSEKMKLESLALELAKLQATVDSISEQKLALESKLREISVEKQSIEQLLSTKETERSEACEKAAAAEKEIEKKDNLLKELFDKIINECKEIVKNAIHEVDNPAFSSATCSIDYFRSLARSLEKSMSSLEKEPRAAERIVDLAHATAGLVVLGKAVSNTAPNIDFGDKMSDRCKGVGQSCLQVFTDSLSPNPTVSASIGLMRQTLKELLDMSEQLQAMLQAGSSESVGEMVESELAAMDKAIEEAARRIEEMLSNSRAADSGIKLEVNEKILDSCTGLMQAIRILVQKSRVLQAEIVAKGKGSASVKEFYKRNHQWTEGLISAAKAVGMGANYLLEAADEVVTSNGKLEKVIAAAQGISASTAQLVVASRVKADRGSAALNELTQASKGVTAATATALTAASACSNLIDSAQDDLDMSKLSLHNAKRLEMESQVRVLELENLLTKERLKLAALRRHHYSLSPESDQPLPL